MPMHREWVDLGMSGLQVATGVTMVPLDILFDMREEVNKTVDRLIVGITAHCEDPSTNESGIARLNMGIGVATAQAFANAAAGDPPALPRSGVTEDFPIRGWLWRAQYGIVYDNAADHLGVYVFPRIDLDLRASRKVDKGILYFTATNTAILGTLDVELTGMIRAHILTG